jgi:phosphate transporter
VFRYDALKKYIYQLEKRQSVHRQRYRDNEATEHSALISDVDGHPSSSGDDTDAVFRPLIDKEIDKVSAFYIKQEHELVLAVAELEALVHDEEERGRGDAHWTEDHEHDDEDDDEDDGDEEDDQVAELQPSARANGKDRASRSPSHTRRQSSEESGLEDSLASLPPLATAQLRGSARRGSSSRSPIATRSQGPGGRTMTSRLRDSVMSSGFLSWHGDAPNASTWNAGSHYAQDTRLLFKRKITNLYVSVTSLKSYAEVNQSGFRKILKK